VRTCVIFNPAARGDKARRFRRHLDDIGKDCVRQQTVAAGEARRLAADAGKQGFEVVVAGGGDGTLNEVLNGIGDVADGFERTRLGVLPLGTVNGFARELKIPTKLEHAWETIRKGKETRIDLPAVEYSENGKTVLRYFAQLAGAGLDARAIDLVKWQVKKLVGPLAYVLAGLHALLAAPSRIAVSAGKDSGNGELILIGNGRLYGGNFRLFPRADLRDGLLEVCVFPRVNWITLARCSPGLLLNGALPASAAYSYQAQTVALTGETTTPLQIDGELIGHLPATFTIQPSRLRVIIP